MASSPKAGEATKGGAFTGFFKKLFITKNGKEQHSSSSDLTITVNGQQQEGSKPGSISPRSPLGVAAAASSSTPTSPKAVEAPSKPVAPPPPVSLKPSVAAASSPVGAAKSSPRVTASSTNTVTLFAAPVLPPNMARAVWCLKDYVIVEKMYTGYASTVYKAWCKASGETVCLKAYNLGNLCELNRFQIFREIKLHSKLQHENIIALYGAFQQGDQEFAESGDLFMLLHRYGGKLPEKTAVEMVLHPFLLVLNYLHQNCVVHRDIKPENVLFTRSMQLKLCDFGLALDLREERAVTRAGTLEYMAPEVLDCPFKNRPEENKEKANLYYSLTVDTWAVGVLSYELVVGFPPFNDKQRSAIEDKIRLDTPRFPSSISELARTFMLKALQKDALERPTIMELITHPWVRSYRRNASVRLPNKPGSTSKQQRFAADVLGGGDEDEPALPGSPTGGRGLSSKAPAKAADKDQEMRTVDGDLLRQVQTFKSFTASSRPKLAAAAPASQPQLPGSVVAAVAAAQPKALRSKHAQLADLTSGMSFSSAQNPKLQALRNTPLH